MLFCQREAAETAIYLAEVAGRHGEPDFRTRIDPQRLASFVADAEHLHIAQSHQQLTPAR